MEGHSAELRLLRTRQLLLREVPDVTLPWWAEAPALTRLAQAEAVSLSAALLRKTMAGTVTGLQFVESVRRSAAPPDTSPAAVADDNGPPLTYVDVLQRTLNRRVTSGRDLPPEVAALSLATLDNMSRAVTAMHAAAESALAAASEQFGATSRHSTPLLRAASVCSRGRCVAGEPLLCPASKLQDLMEVLQRVHHTQHKLHRSEYAATSSVLDLLHHAALARRQLLEDVASNAQLHETLAGQTERLRGELQRLQAEHTRCSKARDDMEAAAARYTDEIKSVQVRSQPA